jgi:hypothetical protein
MGRLAVPALAAALCGLLVAACAAGPAGRAPTGTRVPDPTAGLERGAAVRWDAARLDGRRLTLYFTGGAPPQAPVGPCAPRYTAEARVTAGAVAVTLWPWLPPRHGQVACTAIGVSRTFVLTLPEPLGGRRVVDGAGGGARQVVDGSSLREPTYLPAGYRPGAGEPFKGSYTQRWGHGADELLSVRQGGARAAELGYRPVVLGRTTVHGFPATGWKSAGFDDSVCLSWREGSSGFAVCSNGPRKAPLPVAELRRVAEGRR